MRHRLISRLEDLPALRTSKYAQSTVEPGVFKGIANALAQNRPVLFSGCPCQVAGLRLFLKTDPPQLLTCALACHGIPSPGWFARYREQCDAARQVPVAAFSFRDKAKGWKKFQVRQDLEDGRVIREPFGQNYFMWSFLRNLCLRQTCYDCRYKGENIPADLILADFWGVEKLHPEYDSQDQGTSLLLVNTAKGMQAVQAASGALLCAEVEAEPAIRQNPPIRFSFPCPPQRQKFMRDAFRLKLTKLRKKYPASPPPPSLAVRAIQKLKRILSSRINGFRNRA